MTISRVKFPWPPFFRIFIFFDEVFITVCGTTYLMRDDGATVVNLRPSRVIWSRPNPTDLSVQPRSPPQILWFAKEQIKERTPENLRIPPPATLLVSRPQRRRYFLGVRKLPKPSYQSTSPLLYDFSGSALLAA